MYHKLGVDIITDEEALTLYESGENQAHGFGSGNVLVIGGYENMFARRVLLEGRSQFRMDSNGTWSLNHSRLRQSLGMNFFH